MNRLLSQITSNIDHSIKKDDGPFFTYLIGNNGSGKSRVLKALAEHYAEMGSNRIRSIACISNGVYDRYFELGKFQKVQYMGARSVNNAVFHAAIDRELAKYVTTGIGTKANFKRSFQNAVEIDLSISFSPVSKSKTGIQRFFDQRKIKSRPLTDIISLDEQRWILTIISQSTSLKKLTKIEATTLNKFLSLNPSVELKTSKNNFEYSFKELSSGEQNRILTAAKLLSSATDRSLILIDEPEVSLHLHWQMEFHNYLSEMVSHLKNFHIVIATHSPIIVSEAARDRKTQKNIVVLGPEEAPSSNYETLSEDAGNRSSNFNEDENDELGVTGTYFDSRTIHSHDGLVLDFFNTATYNSKQVIEEVADIILQATDEGPNTVDFETQLSSLLKKKGISNNDTKIVNKAINLIKQHTKAENAKLSNN